MIPIGRKTTRLQAGVSCGASDRPAESRNYCTLHQGDPVWFAEHQARIEAHAARVAAVCRRLGIHQGDLL